MSGLLKGLEKSHASLRKIEMGLASMRYRANASRKPTYEQLENALESAFWRASNAANELSPYVSALRTLEQGEKS